MRTRSFRLFVAVSGYLSVSGAAGAQTPVREGMEAFGGWRQDKPGTVRLIRPRDLPQPGATASVANVSRVVARPYGAKLQVPAGFKVGLFAEGLSGPRIIRVAPNGDIFVAETRTGRIRILRAADRAAKPGINRYSQAASIVRSASRSFRAAMIRNGSTSQTPTAWCASPIIPAI